MKTQLVVSVIGAAFVAACSKSQVPPATQAGVTEVTGAVARSPSLAIAPEILEKCAVEPGPNLAPKFKFDDATLHTADRELLASLARCLTTGPLNNASIWLVGRADPRGSTEYNMALGANRASEVASYLAAAGVQASRLYTTSRGELDARGVDESSWAEDRRVNISLRQ